MKTLYEIIATKRDGGTLSADEISRVVGDYTAGRITDYQMSALLMAAFVRGLDAAETAALTQAMLDSGDKVAVNGLDRPLIDKHSTGGVGDKLSLILSPVLAGCGISVGMFSGRGLGHTGGTLDKLESISGTRVFLTPSEFGALIKKHGFAFAGQTERIAPADRKIYALRDASGTVESIPLIVASIMSKKLALKSDGIVFDVKTGSGAFMQKRADALKLAAALLAVASERKLPASAVITNMDQPTGATIGNWLEIIETADTLRGGGPKDTIELTVAVGAQMLRVAGVEPSPASARSRVRRELSSGRGYERFCRYVTAVGGKSSLLELPRKLLERAHKAIVRAPRSGYIAAIDARRIGFLALRLGAGRAQTTDRIDPLAGIEMPVKIGMRVAAGEPIATIYASDRNRLSGIAGLLAGCITIGDSPIAPLRAVLKRM